MRIVPYTRKVGAHTAMGYYFIPDDDAQSPEKYGMSVGEVLVRAGCEPRLEDCP